MAKAVERYYTILRRPRVTEKGLKMAERHHAYPFEVDATANKIEIRQAVEAIFNVKVKAVRTMNMLGKRKRMGRWWGRGAGVEEGDRAAPGGLRDRGLLLIVRPVS